MVNERREEQSAGPQREQQLAGHADPRIAG
jgi:hypothetical protein